MTLSSRITPLDTGDLLLYDELVYRASMIARPSRMNLRNLRFVSAVPVVISLASGLAVAQSKKSTSEGVVTASYKTPNYKAPRTPDGQPDLQGVWSNNTATPLQRPKELAGKEFLTEQEVTGLKREADKLFKDGAS